jgi:uncharacterized membrane protein YhaH (DUF805 family)
MMEKNEGWCAPMGRAWYGLIGVILVQVKFQLDRWMARLVWHREWWPDGYFRGGDPFSGPGQASFYGMMAALAVPFVLVGCWLTLKRLRDLQWSPFWVLLFFVPGINLLFFLLLCAVPGKAKEAEASEPKWIRWLPDSKLGATLLSVAVTTLAASLLVYLGTHWMRHYGWGLFCGIPFAQGFVSVQVAAARQKVGWARAILLATLCVLVTGLVLLAVALEGVICLVMAFPIAWVLAVVGALLGTALQHSIWPVRRRVQVSCAAWAALAVGIVTEPRLQWPVHVAPVVTSVDIAAPPETVWRHVVVFSELDPPKEWFFRLGVAYPKHAVIRGTGVGAVRNCVFSTGPFVEPITVWDEPNLLAFDVTAQPQPMIELSWVDELHTPHLDGYLRSVKGQFRLERLPDGGTRLEGTTWYANLIWPEAYWRVWSDWFIHGIHGRVLNHIKREAEAEG